MRTGDFVQALEARRLLSANLVADFDGFYPTNAVEVGDVSYFTANDGVHGTELWKSDGTMQGTKLVRDITPGADGSEITSILPFKRGVMFISHSSERSTVWYSDGTPKRTVPLATFTNGDYVVNPADRLVNGRFLFSVGEQDFWSSDGTAAGTHKIATIDGYIGGRAVGYVSNRMLWSNDTGSLWSTDGTIGGTFKMPPLQGGLPSDMPGWWWVDELKPFNGKLVAVSMLTTELWITDGTIGGTQKLGDGPTPLQPLFQHNGLMYLWGLNPRTDLKTEIFVTDGTPQSAHLLVPLNEEVRNLMAAPVGDKVYIFGRADDDQNSVRMWVTDGSADGTRSIGSVSKSLIHFPIVVDGKVYFFVRPDDSDGSAGGSCDLWMIDSDDDQIAQLKSIDDAYIGAFKAVSGKLFFTVLLPNQSPQLWKSDGSMDGTYFVKNLASLVTLDAIDGNLVLSWSGLNNSDKHYVEILDPNSDAPPRTVAQNMSRLVDGTLRIYGTETEDAIRVYRGADSSRIYVQINGVKRSFDASAINKIVIYGYGGDDKIEIFEKRGIIAVRSRIFGGQGDDTICTGSGQDSIYAENGDDIVRSGNSADVVSGDDGNDTINAGGGNDTANGDAGTDSIIGGAGADMLGGGDDQSDDFLDGGSGQDVVFGSAVYDIFYKPTGDPGELVDCILQS